MEPTNGVVGGDVADQQLFTAYGQHDPSPVLTWVPILLGLIASAIVALLFCPVPRSTVVSAAKALFLAIAYVLAIVVIGAVVFSASSVIVASRKRETPIWRILPFVCGVAAWLAPLIAFYARDSLWAVLAGLVLSILGSKLIYSYYLGSRMGEMLTSSAESRTDGPRTTSLVSLSFAALLLEFGALSTTASSARPATVLIGCAIVVFFFSYQSANQPPVKLRFPRMLSCSITLGFAVILVAASLTPYLEGPIEDASDMDAASSGHSTLRPSGRSSKNKSCSIRSFVVSKIPGPQFSTRNSGQTRRSICRSAVPDSSSVVRRRQHSEWGGFQPIEEGTEDQEIDYSGAG